MFSGAKKNIFLKDIVASALERIELYFGLKEATYLWNFEFHCKYMDSLNKSLLATTVFLSHSQALSKVYYDQKYSRQR